MGGVPVARAARVGQVALDRSTQVAIQNQAAVAGVPEKEAGATQVANPSLPETQALDALLDVFESLTGHRGIAVHNSENDGFEFRGNTFISVDSPHMHVAQTIGHEFKHLTERHPGLKGLYDRLWGMVDNEAGKEAYFKYLFDTHDRIRSRYAGMDAKQAYAAIRPEHAAKLKNEMLADFMGKRFNDRAWLAELGKKKPELFGNFIRDWIRVLGEIIGKLAGRKDKMEGVKNVDLYISQLQEAKAIAMEVAEEWAKMKPNYAQRTGVSQAIQAAKAADVSFSAKDYNINTSRDDDDEGTFFTADSTTRKTQAGGAYPIAHLHVPDEAVKTDGWRIGDIYVDAGRRREGIASALVDAASKHFGSRPLGATSVFSEDGQKFWDGISKSAKDNDLAEDDYASLQAELDAEMGQAAEPARMPEIEPDVSDAAIRKAGIHAEDAFPPHKWSGGGDQHTLSIKGLYGGNRTVRLAIERISNGAYSTSIEGAWVGPASDESTGYVSLKGAKAFIDRQIAARELRARGYDLASSLPAEQRAALREGWEAINALGDEFGVRRYPLTSELDTSIQDLAKSMGLTEAYKVTSNEEVNDRDNKTLVIAFTDKVTGKTQSGTVNMTRIGGKWHTSASTIEFKKGGLGTAFYQLAVEYLARKGLQLSPEATLSGINTYRRTEQMLAAALRIGISNAMVPHPVQRVYGFQNDAQSDAEHAANLERLLIANLRNVRELVPEFDRLRYHPETGAITFKNGRDAEKVVERLIGHRGEKLTTQTDARAFGLGRTTLARALMTQAMLDGKFQEPESFAEPVTYSARDQAAIEYEAVEARYKGTPQWMKAPNGKPTNLTERQWVQVRTPMFQKWFGPFLMDSEISELLLSNQPSGGPVSEVFQRMGKLVLDSQILDSVIASIPVDVMNDLGGKQGAVDMLLHDPSMFVDIATSGKAQSDVVAFLPGFSSGAEGVVAISRAKLGLSKATPANAEVFAAIDALQNNLVFAWAGLTNFANPGGLKDVPVESILHGLSLAGVGTKPYSPIYVGLAGVEIPPASFTSHIRPIFLRGGLAGDAAKLSSVGNLDGLGVEFDSTVAASGLHAKDYKVKWREIDQKYGVSRVVDENGEPLVVYHGSDNGGFMAFETPGGQRRGDLGIFASSDYDMADSYVRRNRTLDVEAVDLPRTKTELEAIGYSFLGVDGVGYSYLDDGGYETGGFETEDEAVESALANYESPHLAGSQPGIYALFVNLRNPSEIDFEGATWSGSREHQWVVEVGGEIQSDTNGTQYFNSKEDAADFAQTFVADDAEGDDADPLSYVRGADDHYESTDDAVRGAWADGSDGVIIRNVIDDGGGPSQYMGEPRDVFVARHGGQLKSANWNTGEFGTSTDDLRFSKKTDTQSPPLQPRASRITDLARQNVVSTRSPTGARAVENQMTNMLTGTFDAFGREPTLVSKATAAFRGYAPIKLRKGLSNVGVLNSSIAQMANNLTWLYDKVPSNIRERSKIWYVGARRIADRMSGRYGIDARQVAGVIATQSPQKDWFENVSLADRIIHVWTNYQDHAWDRHMDAAIERVIGAEALAEMADNAEGDGHDTREAAIQKLAEARLAKARKSGNELSAADARQQVLDSLAQKADAARRLVDAVRGKKLSEVWDDKHRAVWVRMFDSAHINPHYHVVSPEGNLVGLRTTSRQAPSNIRWGTFGATAKSISILRDGTLENISNQLGAEHKIRNFYNNIIDPFNPGQDITIDTHAVAADLMMPLSGNSLPVSHNFGSSGGSIIYGLSGTYPVHHEAYSRAAAGKGVLGREMQSITWEAVRGLFTAPFKSKSANVDHVNSIWERYKSGEISQADARNEIIRYVMAKTNRTEAEIFTPEWFGSTDAPQSETSFDMKRDVPAAPLRGRVDSGIYAEVAPNPDLVKRGGSRLLAKWAALSEDEKMNVTRNVGAPIIHKVMARLGIKAYDIEFGMGGFEGETNPSITIHLGPSAPYGAQMEAAKVIGVLWKQKAMIAYDERDSGGGTQFVKVAASRPLDYNGAAELFRKITQAFPAAAGVSLRDGALVFGNFTDGAVSEQDFHDGIDAALTDDYETNSTTFRSDWIEPVTLEGTRYASETQGDQAGRDVPGWERDFGAIQSESDERFAREVGYAFERVQARGRSAGSAGDVRDAVQRSARPSAGRGGHLDPSEPDLQRSSQGSLAERPDQPAAGGRPDRALRVQGAVHFGKAPGLSVLSGSASGTGIKGAEQERLSQAGVDPRLKRRVYFYLPVDGGIPQPEIGLGTHVYRMAIADSGNTIARRMLNGKLIYADMLTAQQAITGQEVKSQSQWTGFENSEARGKGSANSGPDSNALPQTDTSGTRLTKLAAPVNEISNSMVTAQHKKSHLAFADNQNLTGGQE